MALISARELAATIVDRLRDEPLIAARNAKAIMRVIERAIEPIVEENNRLEALLNTPEVHDFVKAVVLEAAHQRERWGVNHDAGKTDADWFWLIGFLAGKALYTPVAKDLILGVKPEDGDLVAKRLHRIITIAAAAANWHAQVKRASQ